MNKIKRVSNFFHILFQIVFIALPILLIIIWIQAPSPIGVFYQQTGILINFIPQSIKILHPLDNLTKLLGFSISLLALISTELVLYFLIKLFRLYANAEIFSLQSVRYIKYVAYSLLLGQLINPIYQGVISAFLTWGNPKGHRVATISLDGTNLGILLLSLLIILISWIMAEGYKLREEQQYTI